VELIESLGTDQAKLREKNIEMCRDFCSDAGCVDIIDGIAGAIVAIGLASAFSEVKKWLR